MAAQDSADLHANDTIRAGAGTVAPEVAHQVTRAARDHILDLTTLGTPFDRDAEGGYVLSREAAHSLARVVRVKGDQAGAEIMKALVAEIRSAPSIQVLEGVAATGLAVAGGRVVGLDACRVGESPSASIRLCGAAHLLAGGGSCGLYALTTNPRRIRGEVIGMAARAGAEIADPEFVQFHPTAIDIGEDPAALATEALRGDGARLVNREGVYFMASHHPDADLAPRDVVARAVFAAHRSGQRPALDARHIFDGEQVLFPAVLDACRRNGIDPAIQPIPVAPAAHYHMGGIATDHAGATSLPGLWACGEAASTGLHGANRLASNGLLEALVFASASAEDMAARLGPAPTDAPPVDLVFNPGGLPVDEQAVTRLRRIMSDHVGVVRTAEGLRLALAGIARLDESHGQSPAFANMIATATLIAAAALLREESRGAHFREDFPQPPAPTGERTRITLDQAIALRNRYKLETT